MALQTREQSVSLQLGFISLKQSVFDALKQSTGKTEAEIGPALNALCVYFLTEHARGGIMLSGQDVVTIEKSTGKEVETAKDIVAGFQSASGRPDGQFSAVVTLDPAFEEQLKQTAQWQGLTPQEVLNDTVNTCVANSWAYNWTASGGTVNFDAGDFQYWKDMTGKALPTGKEITRAAKKKPEAV